MSDSDNTIPQSQPSPAGGSNSSGPGLRRVTVLASVAGAAIVAVLLGAIVAVQSSDNVLSPQDVAQRLAADASASPGDRPGDDLSPSAEPSASASTGASAQPQPGGAPSVIDTVAATVALTCDGSRITKATWSIKPGYRLDERTQTSTRLRLWIESDVHEDVTLIAVCPAKVTVTAEPDDHGGDDGDDGDDHGGGGKGRG